MFKVGDEVLYREGTPAKVIHTNAKGEYPIIALIISPSNGNDYPLSFTEEGREFSHGDIALRRKPILYKTFQQIFKDASGHVFNNFEDATKMYYEGRIPDLVGLLVRSYVNNEMTDIKLYSPDFFHELKS